MPRYKVIMDAHLFHSTEEEMEDDETIEFWQVGFSYFVWVALDANSPTEAADKALEFQRLAEQIVNASSWKYYIKSVEPIGPTAVLHNEIRNTDFVAIDEGRVR